MGIDWYLEWKDKDPLDHEIQSFSNFTAHR
jgi:hypothetical protein